MSTVFVHHQVADFDTWKTVFDDHGSTRREYGLTDSGLYRGADDANDVTIVLAAEDTGRAQEFLDSDSLREAMSNAGVTSAPDVWIAEEA